MNIAVYCGSNPKSDLRFMKAASRLGSWIGQSGNTLVYGGSSVGLMGEVSKACMQAGGSVFGVEPKFFIEAGVAQHDLTRLYEVETMTERRLKMIELADVFVALPGGVGTLEEISEIMSRIRLRMSPAPCFILNMDGFYDGLIELIYRMVEARFIDTATKEDFVFVASVDELIESLKEFKPLDKGNAEKPVVPESNLIIG